MAQLLVTLPGNKSENQNLIGSTTPDICSSVFSSKASFWRRRRFPAPSKRAGPQDLEVAWGCG